MENRDADERLVRGRGGAGTETCLKKKLRKRSCELKEGKLGMDGQKNCNWEVGNTLGKGVWRNKASCQRKLKLERESGGIEMGLTRWEEKETWIRNQGLDRDKA